MYEYVEDKQFLKRAQNCCSDIMKQLEESLREQGMNTQFFLVGSGARNMITQNGDGDIDFDYNLNIISCDDWKARSIKELIRKTFNKVMRQNNLSEVEDSTSSLTTKLIYFNDEPDIEFKIDVCIVTEQDDNWYRLINKKTGFMQNDEYIWNEAPHSKNCKAKADQIKKVPGWWEVVRKEYIEIKNHYLRYHDDNHPSYICYVEAVNAVYNNMRQKHIIK